MRLIILGLATALCFAAGSARACDDQQLGQQLAAQWQPQIAAATGPCQTAVVMQNMLHAAERAYAQCLHGQSLKDAVSKLEASIAQWKQNQLESCG